MIQTREPSSNPTLVEAATTAKPGSWVYEIDWSYPDDQRTPPEAIVGGWEVGDGGKLTGKYVSNSRYRPIQHPAWDLKPYMHAGARFSRSQWITDVDPRGEHLFPNIPEELIRGWWYVDADGKITDKFRPNSKWKPQSADADEGA